MNRLGTDCGCCASVATKSTKAAKLQSSYGTQAMPRNYYIFSSGRLRREANTLLLEQTDASRRIPIEDVEALYAFGELDLNTKALNFLSQHRVPLHVFNYYGYYAGTYYPREYLHSGHLLVRQAEHYLDLKRRMVLAKELLEGSLFNILRTVAYYTRRRGVRDDESDAVQSPEEGAEVQVPEDGLDDTAPPADPIEVDLTRPDAPDGPLAAGFGTIEELAGQIGSASDAGELMGVEGKARNTYYGLWQHILVESALAEFRKRVRRPPDNPVNALISFGNGLLYAACVGEIYHTQLSPEISYLHEPGERRFSLALDIADVFKPVIVDRMIFSLLNTRQLVPNHFDTSLNGCRLDEDGRKLVVKAFEGKLQSTLFHRRLKRHVSYQRLLRLECYRLIRHLVGEETYRAFHMWW
ncbi:MAG: CRISPR-associated endonuclease Cas1 [Chthonomonadales bacterium]